MRSAQRTVRHFCILVDRTDITDKVQKQRDEEDSENLLSLLRR